MSYGKLSMSQVKKVTRGSIGATSRHNMREDLEHWSTEHVDTERSKYNTILIGRNTGDDIRDDIIGCDMAHNTKKNPNDDPIAAEFVIAPSQEWLAHLIGESEFICTQETCDKLQKHPEFLKWLIETTEALKIERCISAVLHMDERTPHVHAVCSVKMKRESKSKSEKSKKRSKKSEFVLSYSNFYGTRGSDYCLAITTGEKREKLEKKYGKKYDSLSTPLGQLQTRLWERIGQPFGMERGEAASVTGIKGKSVKQWRIEQGKAKVDSEVRQEIEKYSKDKEIEVSIKKKEIDKKAEVSISSFELETKNKIDVQKASIEKISHEEISAFTQSEKVRIQKQCNDIRSQANASILSYESEVMNVVNNKISSINNKSKKRLEDYEEQKRREEEEEKERLRKKYNISLENLRKEEEEFDISVNNLMCDYEKQKVLANQLTLLQKEQNSLIEDAINNLKKQLGERVNAITDIISRHLLQLEKLSSYLGYAVEKIGALAYLKIFKNKILADSRFKTGRQVLASRREAEKRINDAIKLGDDVEKTSNIIDNFKP